MIKEMFKKNSGSKGTDFPETEETLNGADSPKGQSNESGQASRDPQENQDAPKSGDDSDNLNNLKNSEGTDNPVEAAYCLGAGIDADTLAKAKEIMASFAEAVASKEFNAEALQMAIRLINYDEKLEAARREGRESAKTEAILEAFANKRRKAEEAAAIPYLGGTKEIGQAREDSIFDVARRAH